MSGTLQLRVDIPSLEVARGHDGFLRGRPEPVVVLGVYVAGTSSVQLIEREVFRFEVATPFPSVARKRAGRALECSVRYAGGEPASVFVAVALEQDGAGDVQRIYGQLEQCREISLYRSDSDPEPASLTDLAADPTWRDPATVQLLVGGRVSRDECASDKFIGAVAWSLETGRLGGLFRLHFLADDHRNDWTALAKVDHTEA